LKYHGSSEVSTQIFIFSCEFVGSDICTRATILEDCFNLTSSEQQKSCGPDSFQVDSCL